MMTKFLSIGMVVAFAVLASGEGGTDVYSVWGETDAMTAAQGNLQLVAILAGVELLLYPLNCFCEWHDMFAKM